VIGKYRTPPLRGLLNRAPYFHDGNATTVADLIAHYDQFFFAWAVGPAEGGFDRVCRKPLVPELVGAPRRRFRRRCEPP
jgi:hypothetical protein